MAGSWGFPARKSQAASPAAARRSCHVWKVPSTGRANPCTRCMVGEIRCAFTGAVYRGSAIRSADLLHRGGLVDGKELVKQRSVVHDGLPEVLRAGLPMLVRQ